MELKNKTKIIIGLTGVQGSGKDTVADYLKEKGFIYHSLSDILRDVCRSKNLEITRENLINIGNDLRNEFGNFVLAQKTITKIKENPSETNSIIVSIRNIGEVTELKKEKGFFLISVDAPIEIRYKRIQKRQKPEDKISFEKFKEQEEFERKGVDENSQQLNKVIELSDFKIDNNSTIENLKEKTDEILNQIYYKTKTSEGEK